MNEIKVEKIKKKKKMVTKELYDGVGKRPGINDIPLSIWSKFESSVIVSQNPINSLRFNAFLICFSLSKKLYDFDEIGAK